MKKLLFFLLALGAMQAKAQLIKGSIDLKDSTINRSIPFEVVAGMKSVRYTVKAYLAVGELTISLTDPNDKKSTGFSLGTKTSSGGHEPSKGEISSNDISIKTPGTWKFNIKTENATGTVSYRLEVIKP